MSDKFRRTMDQICDVGGVKCDCCNPFKGKERKKLHRIARSRLKHKLITQVKNMSDKGV